MLDKIPLLPESASTYSFEVDAIYLALVALTVVLVIGIMGAAIYFSIRYRRTATNQMGTDIHGSMLLELTWTAIPLVLAVGLFVWGTKLFFTLSQPPVEAMEFSVVGKQWMWKVQHPTGQREINDLHIPVGRPIRMTMISEDVIHSYFIPEFRTKRDVVPGRYSTLWFEATQPGVYNIFCAEYCGTLHSGMVGKVYALEPLEYERWLAGANANESPRDAGEKLFAAMRCETCHSGQSGARGPNLFGLFGKDIELADGTSVKFDEAYVRESLLKPASRLVKGYTALMPTYAGQLSEDQINSLIAYLKELKEGGAAQ